MQTAQLLERLQAASATLVEVQELTEALPEHREDAVTMQMHLAIANSYLCELQLNLAKGQEVEEAVLTTARGLTPIS